MKFLDISALAILTTQLTRIDAGDSYIYGRIEAYSCTQQISESVAFDLPTKRE